MLNGIKVDVKWSDKALESLREIGDQKKQDKIKKKVDHDLSKDPYKGEPLSGSFKGLRSFHVLGNRVRVAYRVIEEKIKIVLIVKVGWREGFYKRLKRRFG